MTEEAKKLVYEKHSASQFKELQAIATQVINSLGSNGERFVCRVQQFDSIRNQDFSSTHKEIAQAMGYNLIFPLQL